MSEEGPEHDTHRTGDPLEGEGSGEGVEVTMSEPNTFEPEEDPDAGLEHDGSPG